MQSKLSKILNWILLFIIITLISHFILDYYFFDFKLSLILSLVFSLIISILCFSIDKKINKYRSYKSNEIETINELKNTIVFSNNEDILQYFLPIINHKFNNKFNIDDYKILNFDKSIVFTFKFDKRIINDDDIILFIKSNSNRAKYNFIFCFNYHIEDNLIKYNLEKYNIKILNIFEIYDNFFKNDSSIQIPNLDLKKSKKYNRQDIFQIIFSKSKFKSYFLIGLMIFIFAQFTPLKLYYAIFGSILLVSSLFCKFNKKYNVAKQNNLFDNII